MLFRGRLQINAENSNFKHFESALYETTDYALNYCFTSISKPYLYLKGVRIISFSVQLLADDKCCFIYKPPIYFKSTIPYQAKWKHYTVKSLYKMLLKLLSLYVG